MSVRTRITAVGYFICASVVAVGWFFLSIILALALAGVEDNPDMTAPVPWLLRTACAVVFFPMRNLQPWDRFDANASDGSKVLFVGVGMLINSLFWGFLLVFLLRLVAALLFRRGSKDAVLKPERISSI